MPALKRFSLVLVPALLAILPLPDLAAAEGGIPEVTPDYTTDVQTWWAAHPMNPRSPRFAKQITSPEPHLNLRSGESIQAAIDRLPPGGGTLHLAAGTYEPFSIIGRSNVHLLGPDQGEAVITGHSYIAVCAEAMDYVQFDFLTSNFDKRKYRDARVWNLYCHPTRNFYLKNLVFDGLGKTTVDFPGTGIKGPGGALGFKGVRDALVENCTFRNYLNTQTGLQHCGLAWGHYGLTNVWLRGCHFLGEAQYAVYFDGAHGSGLVDCTIRCPAFKSGALLFLANHDFTDDRNENGRIDVDEEKCAKYVVIDHNTFEQSRGCPVRITGQNCLVTGNTAMEPLTELVGIYPTGEIAHRNWPAGEFGIRVTENKTGTCVRALLNLFVTDHAAMQEVEKTPAERRHVLEGNTVGKVPELVHYTIMKP